MDIKSRILGRAKAVQVEFLSEFVPITLSGKGIGSFVPLDETIKPIDAALLVPVGSDGVPHYIDTLGVGCLWSVKGSLLKIEGDCFAEFLSVSGGSLEALISVPRTYSARNIQQFLPREIRSLTNTSAEVMAMLQAKDPALVSRISDVITTKIAAGGGKISERDMGTAVEAALNLELTMRYPELLVDIEALQNSQPAVQLAMMLGVSADFLRIVYQNVPEGSFMINEMLSIIDPPKIVIPDLNPEDAPPAIEHALLETLAEDGEDEEYEEYEDEEINEPTLAVDVAAVEVATSGADDDDDEYEDDDDDASDL